MLCFATSVFTVQSSGGGFREIARGFRYSVIKSKVELIQFTIYKYFENFLWTKSPGGSLGPLGEPRGFHRQPETPLDPPLL